MTSTANPPSPPLSLAERYKNSSADLASLSRVSHRLAMVDTTEILQQVLDKLLPRLLHRVGENHQTQINVKLMDTTTLSSTDQQHYKYLLDSLEKVHAKLIEMLSHAMKRVRHDDKCKLPCRAVLDLLLVTVHEEESKNTATQESDAAAASEQTPTTPVLQLPTAAPHVDPFTLNLTLAFLTMGVPRCDTQALEDLLPGLLVLVGHHSGRVDTLQSPSRKTQWHQLTHLLLRAIENIVQADKDSSAKRNPYATTNNNSATSTNKRLKPSHDTNTSSNQAESPPVTSSLAMAHAVLQQDVQAAGAFYNLMLDVLMYQTVAGNVPPPGLSQAGHDCLRQGVSTTARDWGAEMATRGKLVQLKTQILDFVSPNRRWALFLPSSNTRSNSNSSSNDSNNRSLSLGMARTVALLVIATGDGTPEVSQLATTYLKQHMDSILRSGGGTTTTTTTSTTTSNSNDASVFGNAIALVTELLTLCVGASNAELTLSKKSRTTDDDSIPSLGLQATASSSSSTSTETSQLMLSLKRRMISEGAFAALAAFVAKVLDDSPQLLAPSTASSLSSSYTERVRTVGTLAVLAAHKSLSNLKTASGLTVLRGKPFIAAAQLLNALVIRLSTLPLESGNHNEANTTSSSMSNIVLPLMAKSLSTACQVLSTVSTPRASVASTGATTGNNSEGNVAVRDALYGVICSLSRSSIVLQAKSAAESYFLFALGNSHVQESGSLTVSMDTASLLFGCASNEEEPLRPRALAALDALLAAYCRVYTKTGPQRNGSSTSDTTNQGDNMEVEGVTESTTSMEPANPWSQMATAAALPLCLPSESKAIQAQLASALLPLIWTASRNSQSKASRVAAARWASDLLKEIDLANASHLLCFIAGDPDVTAAAIAKEGLGFKLTSSPSTDGAVKAAAAENGDDMSSIALPDFGELTSLLFAENHEGDQKYYWRPTYWDFSPQGKAAAVKFSMEALLNDLYGGEDVSVEKYVSALTRTLSEIATFGREYIELLDECATCLSTCLSTSAYARTLLLSVNYTNKRASLGLKELDDLALTANSSRARRFLAESCGYLYEDKTFWQQNQLSTEWMQTIQRAMMACAKELKDSRQRNAVVGHIHGAAFLGATCVRAFRLSPVYHAGADGAIAKNCWELACTILGALGDGTLHADDTICNSFSDGLAIALSYTSDDAPILDPQLYPGTTAALIKLWKSIQKYGNGDNANAPRASKLAHAAGICLAASTSGAGFDGSGSTASVVVDEVVYHLGPARLLCVEALFSLLGSMAYRKDEEIALVAGEALASYADAFSPKDAVWSSQTDQWPDNLNEEFAKELPPHEQILYTLLRRSAITSNPHKRTACAPALLAVVARAASRVNRDSNSEHRSLVKEIRGHIDEVQNAFIALLADSKSGHLARESCCLGLAACRGLAGFLTLADDKTESASLELNNKLLRAFGQTSNHGGSAMMETSAQADERRRANAANNGQQAGTEGNLMESFGVGETEVGGTSGLGEAALGAYREMAAAAVSLGRPDVLYTLLILSASHSIWFTPGSRERYSASALLGKQSIVGSRTNSAEMREALRPHLGKLLPRMIRACHDPNRETRERMSNLWLGITGGGAEARQAISDHLLPTMDTLIEEAASKLWRARVGACGALTQIIVARSWRDLGGGSPVLDDDDVLDGAGTTAAGIRLLRLWRAATRALDDVRGNVRESGEHLARTVRGLTIRLCDPSATDAPSGTVVTKVEQANHERDASAAAATSLRWLIKHGLNQPCAEATGVCVSCLVGIVDVANPSILQPLIPALLRSLLFAMSGLEPAALSYLQVRAAGQDSNSGNYDRLERLRIQFAQSGPLATAVTKCLEMLPGVSLETQKAVIPHLDAALRLSAGFASRAATADAVSTLCSTCPNAFKFPGASSTNPSVRLLRALYFASERERGQAARDKMAHALGNIASLCPGGSVRSLALRACSRYNSSTGNNDDPAARRAAAVALRSMAVRASNQFSDGGNSDIWCRRVLPVAFLGMKDSDAKVASMWQEVWEEGGSTANLAGAADDFGSLLEEKLLPHLVKECVKALEDVSWSRRVTGAVALGELADVNILAPSPRSVTTVKTILLADAERAKRRAQSSNTALLSLVKVVAAARLWTGKSEVVKATVKVASKWSAACSNGGDERALFGLGSENGSCPWKPIAVCPGEFENDLFVGDAWFIDDLEGPSDEDVQIDGRSGEAMEVDEGSDEVKIDFDECDKLLETENQASTIEDGGAEEEISRIATFTGLCRILLNQGFPSSAKALLSVAEDEVLPYRAAALQAFKELVDSLGESSQSTAQKEMVFQLLSPKLISVFDTDQKFQLEKPSKEEPPLVVARAIDCLASCFWDGIGGDATHNITTANILKLTEVLEACGGSGQGAWTVREAAAAGCESLTRRSHADGLINPHATFSNLVNCVSQAQKDRKFWRVRLAGLKLLRSMVRRAGNADNSITGIVASNPQTKERQLLLEAMLPHKEKMFSIAKQGLTDSESQITALSTEVLSSMSWWP